MKYLQIIQTLLYIRQCCSSGTIYSDKKSNACNCNKLLENIYANQRNCNDKSSTIVEICLEFSSDYEYLWPFLHHHYSLGFSRIHLYNNDPDPKRLYTDPGIGCLAESGLLHIKPWPGYGVQLEVQNDCFNVIKDFRSRESSDKSLSTIWGANIDVDELVMLHKHTCIGEFLDSFPTAPGVILNWAMYPPLNITRVNTPSLFPHEMLVTRAIKSAHIKTIARLNCFDGWENPHYPKYKSCAGFGEKAVDVKGRRITPGRKPPHKLPNFKIAQLNHYWTYSFNHFLRKMHRGESFHAKMVYRSSYEYFDLQNKTKTNLIYDISFITKYGLSIRRSEALCPHLKLWPPQLSEHNIQPLVTF
eukprot:gene1940-3764_t